MKLGTIVKVSWLVSLILILTGAILKITHSHGSGPWLTIGIITSIVFFISALFEIWTSNRIDKTSKILWTVVLFIFNGLGAIIYILVGRKKTENFSVTNQ